MSETVIRVQNLSKKYRLGESVGYHTLRDTIAHAVTAPLRWLNPKSEIQNPKSNEEDLWALKDVSFEVNRGEVVGIIGRNGAGKSTLLKILSRITEPTEGYVDIEGRVGSLLEVGTGFHPELTGRENIYLNGAILGMSKSDIARKFDEIVAFSEIEKFLDTPVKRYSSGMYMRLAFAVAAHLEPEILIVDEVLAVGDASFQKKCLGKMEDVARHGRTVLFVSHNMQAVQSLCSRGVMLADGKMVAQGTARDIVERYLSAAVTETGEQLWLLTNAPGDEELRLLAVRVGTSKGATGAPISTSQDIAIEMDVLLNAPPADGLCIGFDLMSPEGMTVLRSYQTDGRVNDWPALEVGLNRLRCVIPARLLNGGTLYVCPRISIHNVAWIVHMDAVLQFELVLDHGVSPLWNSLTGQSRRGVVAPVFNWSAVELEKTATPAAFGMLYST
jgi:lipopolysaccharide transport system ATP-binding protein